MIVTAVCLPVVSKMLVMPTFLPIILFIVCILCPALLLTSTSSAWTDLGTAEYGVARIGIIGSAGRMGQALTDAILAAGETLAGTIDSGDAATGLLIVTGGNELRSGPWSSQAQIAPAKNGAMIVSVEISRLPTATKGKVT